MNLAGLRKRIDALDERLLRSLNERARLIGAVAEWKRARGLPVYDAAREKAVLSRLRRKTRGPLSSETVARLFQGLIAEFRRIEAQRMRQDADPGRERLTVAVVGLGLMGGSLAQALKARTPHRVIGVTRGRAYRPSLKACVDELTSRPERALAAADIVILALPLGQALRWIKAWASDARPGSLWTDVGSVKFDLCRAAMRFLPPEVSFIGGHPMAGAEKSGFAHARADLFEGAVYALTPVRPRTGGAPLARMKRLVLELGARPMILSAREHDRRASLTSHLPQFAASALAAAVGPYLRNARGRGLAGSGLRDTTRLADSPAGLWMEIAAYNRGNLRRALEVYMERIRRVKKLSPSGIKELFRRAHEARRSLFTSCT